MVSARMICGIVYGFDGLIGHHASHLCGNANCLNPAHVFPERQETNWSRDRCHSNGYFFEAQCSHSPLCLKYKFLCLFGCLTIFTFQF